MRAATNEEVVLAESVSKASTLLRTGTYLAVVVDQYLLDTEPDETEAVMQHLGTAIVVYANLAICGLERLIWDVRFAVRRRRREEQAAREAAISTLHSELNETMTALLLSSELALGTPGLPQKAAENVQAVNCLVQKLRSQLAAEPERN